MRTLNRVAILFDNESIKKAAKAVFDKNLIFYHETGETVHGFVVHTDEVACATKRLCENSIRFTVVQLKDCVRHYNFSKEELADMYNEVKDSSTAIVLEEAPGVVCYNEDAVRISFTLCERCCK